MFWKKHCWGTLCHCVGRGGDLGAADQRTDLRWLWHHHGQFLNRGINATRHPFACWCVAGGAIANVALVLNVGMIFGLLSMIGATLTLPGIAGIVLTIGMAVDANVLVFERIREELKAGRGPARAIELGYEKALSAILDANITTFITAVILFIMGSGPVRGFSVTLGLGILTSVFTAIFLTRLMIIMWFERKRPRTLEIKGIRMVPQGRVFDFFKRSFATLGASGIAMIASVLLFLIVGLNFGIDFRGGTTIRTESTQVVDVGGYRDALTPLDLGDISIVEVNDVNFRPDQHVSQIRIEAQVGEEKRRPQGVGRADHGGDPGRSVRHRGGAGLYLAPVRMAVLAGCRGCAGP